MHKRYLALLAAIALAGCSSTPTQDAASVEEGAPGGATTAPAGGATTAGVPTPGITGTAPGAGGAPGATGALVPPKDAKGPLSQRVVQFDYDSFVVKDEYQPLVEAHARFLQANRSAKVTLHGHTDERGTREYNIALGQRRADAVKRMMVLVGAGEVQIETVSFGEEKPKKAGSHEEAWAENRRVEIVYVGE